MIQVCILYIYISGSIGKHGCMKLQYCSNDWLVVLQRRLNKPFLLQLDTSGIQESKLTYQHSHS